MLRCLGRSSRINSRGSFTIQVWRMATPATPLVTPRSRFASIARRTSDARSGLQFSGSDDVGRVLFYNVEVMPKGDYLGEFEHIVLLSLLRLNDRAYGVTVRQDIALRTGRDVSVG